MDTSSTSSPFSTRSTIPSSPERSSGNNKPSTSSSSAAQRGAAHSAFNPSSGHLMQGMQALLNNLGASSFAAGFNPSSTDFLRQATATTNTSTSSSSPSDVKPVVGAAAAGASADVKATLPFQQLAQAAGKPAASTSGSAGHGGSRTDPPRRTHDTDELPSSTPPLEELHMSYQSGRMKLMLQGDPQVIHKQRVETAIRVIIDILRTIPHSPSSPVPPSFASMLPHDSAGNILASFERIANFKGLRLQAGTTTKTSSKKQLAAGAIPAHQLAYVETAVYTSGENGKRVYACKRCRNREERRRQNKDAARKKQPVSGADASAAPSPRKGLRPATEDYITGENAIQYDPHRMGQIVEEPPWDPTVPDWRHEIVLFNSPPDVPCKEGSCFWLPFRVICYCKCHGEKVGFRIKFTLRTYDGNIIASEMTHPIKITDDHKTDAKAKPRIDRFTNTNAPQPRARRGRMSTASSQRQSPAPSESEMSVTSEVGAVVQKQTPQVRQGKPYERPPSQSPAVQTSNLPFDFMNTNANDRPRLSRQQSASSYASQPDISTWNDPMGSSTVSPDALRRPNFGNMTAALNELNVLSASSSVAPSTAQQLAGLSMNGISNGMSNGMGSNGLDSSNDLYRSGLDLASLNRNVNHNMLFGNEPREDVDMSNVAAELENMLFGGSSHASVASSSFHDDSSVFSGFQPGSLFSDSGLAPDNTLDDMIDYSGGESTGALSPMQHLNLSPTVGMGQLDLTGMGQSPFAHANGLPQNNGMMPQLQQQQQHQQHQQQQHQQHQQNNADAQTRALLALLAQQQAQQQQEQQQRQRQQPVPVVSHVIPAEGDMAGGTPIAIAGRLFTPETVICFGGRPAVTSFVSDSFIQCTLPPSPHPGDVEVTVQGMPRDMTAPAMMFKYTGMDKEMMRLMLEVRQLHQSSDPAMRLVDHIARSNHNSDLSDRASMSPSGNVSSPFDADAAPVSRSSTPPVETDLQATLITFLESLDQSSPGSLRRSGVVNHRNKAQQSLLHIATVMGFSSLLRRLILVGAHLDLQDVNGFTPLAFAAFCGQTACARVLLEAGASYDIATNYGEMPLDLTKIGDQREVEAILLSAVWSTNRDDVAGDAPSVLSGFESSSEIDDDNPSSESDDGGDSVSNSSHIMHPPRRASRRAKGKQREQQKRIPSPRHATRRLSMDGTTVATAAAPADDPPPYAPSDHQSWMSRTLSNIPHPIPDWYNINALWGEKAPPGWVAFPAPSWDTLQKMTSPEEVKMFTQAMAAAAFNAVVQSGATTRMDNSTATPRTPVKTRPARRRSSSDSQSSGRLSASEVVRQVRQDRMLYLFWLPVLLFVGFWLLVTALPIATGFCLLYARQISRAIKQRL